MAQACNGATGGLELGMISGCGFDSGSGYSCPTSNIVLITKIKQNFKQPFSARRKYGEGEARLKRLAGKLLPVWKIGNNGIKHVR